MLCPGQPTVGGVLNALGDQIRAGENLVLGQLVTFPQWRHRIVVETVPNPGKIVFEANRFYQLPDEASVPVYQLSYDDKAGRSSVGGRLRRTGQAAAAGRLSRLT